MASASGLSATGIFGAVILEWEAPAYNGHNHTEVWRAQVDDREQASLVRESNGSHYTDVTGIPLSINYQSGGFNAGESMDVGLTDRAMSQALSGLVVGGPVGGLVVVSVVPLTRKPSASCKIS